MSTIIANHATRRRAAAAERRGVIMGRPAIGYTAIGDTYAATPHVVIELRHADHLHHATQTAAARRIARELWGDRASVTRLSAGRYEGVWCGYTVPLPSFMESRYGQYRTAGLVEL